MARRSLKPSKRKAATYSILHGEDAVRYTRIYSLKSWIRKAKPKRSCKRWGIKK